MIHRLMVAGLVALLTAAPRPSAAQAAPPDADPEAAPAAENEPQASPEPEASPPPPPPAGPVIGPGRPPITFYPSPPEPARQSPHFGAGEDSRLDTVPAGRRADDPNLSPAERVSQKPWLLMLGARSMLVSDSGFDPFADSNELTQFSLGVGRSFYAREILSLAAIAFWDVGSRTSSARGEPTRLLVHRLALGPELRLHPLTDLYGFLRFAPALIHSEARLEESTTGSTYYARSDDLDLNFLGSWSVGFDATVGAAYELIGTSGRHAGALRCWIMAEGGYAWGTSGDLELSPEADDTSAPERAAALELGTLALRGPMARAVVGVSF